VKDFNGQKVKRDTRRVQLLAENYTLPETYRRHLDAKLATCCDDVFENQTYESGLAHVLFEPMGLSIERSVNQIALAGWMYFNCPVFPHQDGERHTLVYFQHVEKPTEFFMTSTLRSFEKVQVNTGEIYMFDSTKLHWLITHGEIRLYVCDCRLT